MSSLNRVSADSHLEISPNRWRDRVEAKYRDQAPRVVKLAEGGSAILVEGKPLHPMTLSITGKPFEEQDLRAVEYEGAPGAGTEDHRLKEQESDGIDAEVLFTSPGNSNLWRGVRDDNAYEAIVRAYNEFLGEEYCAVDRRRLVGVGIIPVSRIEAAVEELEHCARLGLKAVMLSTFPNGKGFPTQEDDRFWATAIDLGIAVTSHVGFVNRQGPYFQYPRAPKLRSPAGPDADAIRSITRHASVPGESTTATIQLIAAGVFDRFPALHIYFAETQVGWLPSALEQMDDMYKRNRHWMERDFGIRQFKRPPSEYFREHTSWGFLYDKVGVQCRHYLNIEHLMWGNDFPHAAGNWPNSRNILEEMFSGVSKEEEYKMTAGNAIRFFHLSN
jgi:predicted TIM-barrel fold metal-dependent hydrolase